MSDRSDGRQVTNERKHGKTSAAATGTHHYASLRFHSAASLKQNSSDHHQHLVSHFLIVFKGQLLMVDKVDDRTNEAEAAGK